MHGRYSALGWPTNIIKCLESFIIVFTMLQNSMIDSCQLKLESFWKLIPRPPQTSMTNAGNGMFQ